MRQSIETSLAPGAGHMSRPEAHRLDELSAGYCLAGCSPAAPASAFPAVSEYCNSVARKSTIFQRTVTVPLCRCLSLGVRTMVLLAAAELLVPILDHADRWWRGFFQRLAFDLEESCTFAVPARLQALRGPMCLGGAKPQLSRVPTRTSRDASSTSHPGPQQPAAPSLTLSLCLRVPVQHHRDRHGLLGIERSGQEKPLPARRRRVMRDG